MYQIYYQHIFLSLWQTHTGSVALLESFRVLNLSKLESFRALILTLLEIFRALPANTLMESFRDSVLHLLRMLADPP